MLQRVLEEIEQSQEPLNLADLARRMGIEQSALEGMIEYWVRRGRLKDDRHSAEEAYILCSGRVCGTGSSCPGPQECPFIITAPRTFSLTPPPDPEE